LTARPTRLINGSLHLPTLEPYFLLLVIDSEQDTTRKSLDTLDSGLRNAQLGLIIDTLSVHH
jgi:hypothetical protein